LLSEVNYGLNLEVKLFIFIGILFSGSLKTLANGVLIKVFGLVYYSGKYLLGLIGFLYISNGLIWNVTLSLPATNPLKSCYLSF